MQVPSTSDDLAVLAEAGVAVARNLDLDETLQAIIEAGRRLTGARYSALGVLGPDRRIARFVTSGIDEAHRELIGHPPVGRGILGLLIDDARPLRLRDLGSDPRAVGFPPNHPPMTSFLGVPIQGRGGVFGNLYLTEQVDGEFTEDHERVVGLLADQASVAIENARLYEEARRQADEARRAARARASLGEVAGTVLAERDVGDVMRALATEARGLVNARLVAIGVPDEVAGAVRFHVAVGEGPGAASEGEVPLHGSLPGTVLQAGEGMRLDAVGAPAALDAATAGVFAPQSLLVAPLILRDESVAVLLAVDSERPEGFTDEDEELLGVLASLGAIAFQTARAFGRERARSAALVRLRQAEAEAEAHRTSLRRVVEAQERERRRIAQDLHDRTAGTLASIQLALRRLERELGGDVAREQAAAIRSDVGAAIEDVRDLIVDLRPRVLDDFGLGPALDRLCSGFARRTGLRVECAPDAAVDAVGPEVATAAYRIVQEALVNVVRHAAAERVTVAAGVHDGRLVVVIEDDGRGLDGRGEGYGLEGMRERASIAGGRLELAQPTQGGTRVLFEAPL